MTPAAFLKLALSLPEAALGSHQGGADIRVANKIFATPADRPGGAAILKFTPEQQAMMCEAEPKMFEPVPGGWGRQGSTRCIVAKTDAATAKSALWMAWRNAAPKKLQKEHAA
jgi:hypothetical protein